MCVEEGPGMRILRCGDGVNCMVCDNQQIVVGLLNKTIEVTFLYFLQPEDTVIAVSHCRCLIESLWPR